MSTTHVEAELQVLRPGDVLGTLEVADDVTSPTGEALPVIEQGARDALADILAALVATLTVDGEVSLSPATLAALETINAVVSGTVALDGPTLAALETISVGNLPSTYPLPTGQVTTLTPQTNALTDTELRSTPVPVSGTVTVNEPVTVDGTVSIGNLPADYPDAAVLTVLGSVLTELGQKLEAGQSVELGATTLAALETIHSIIDSGTVELGATSLAALESITAAVSGTVAVSGSVEVSNDAGNPLPVSGTVTANTGLSQPLTDTQLRATPVPVSGTVNPTTPSTLVSFVTTVTTAGTRVQLASNAVQAGILQAPSTNTGLIYVGGVTVSGSVFGAELQPGQATGIAIDNTNRIYVDASANGDKCAFLGSN